MDQSITVRYKRVCGRDMFYAECKISQLIVDLCYNRHALTLTQLMKIRELGFKINYSGIRNPVLDELGATYLGNQEK